MGEEFAVRRFEVGLGVLDALGGVVLFFGHVAPEVWGRFGWHDGGGGLGWGVRDVERNVEFLNFEGVVVAVSGYDKTVVFEEVGVGVGLFEFQSITPTDV